MTENETCLRLTDRKLGYLINFSEALMKDEITRCVNGIEDRPNTRSI